MVNSINPPPSLPLSALLHPYLLCFLHLVGLSPSLSLHVPHNTTDVEHGKRTNSTRRNSTNRVKMFFNFPSNFLNNFLQHSIISYFIFIPNINSHTTIPPTIPFHFFLLSQYLNKQQSCHLQDLIKDL